MHSSECGSYASLTPHCRCSLANGGIYLVLPQCRGLDLMISEVPSSLMLLYIYDSLMNAFVNLVTIAQRGSFSTAMEKSLPLLQASVSQSGPQTHFEKAANGPLQFVYLSAPQPQSLAAPLGCSSPFAAKGSSRPTALHSLWPKLCLHQEGLPAQLHRYSCNGKSF